MASTRPTLPLAGVEKGQILTIHIVPALGVIADNVFGFAC